MQRYLLLGLCVFLAVLAVCLLVHYLTHRNLEPLTSVAQKESALPQDTIIINAADALVIGEPFALREEVTAVGGLALVLPEGQESRSKKGMAGFTFRVPSKGKYQAWARVRWLDSCSNSLSITVEDLPKRMIGGDHVYGTWHWVNAGQYDLESSLNRTTIHEREDGVALDQILLTPNLKFLPTGPIFPKGEGVGVRRFSDNFSRSPGHGMEAWDILSGKWEIAFSLDPNRIPNQYSLVGKPDKKAGKTVVIVRGPPWKACRLAFSALPPEKGEFGAVLERSRSGDQSLNVGIELSEGRAALKVTGRGRNESCDLGDAVRPNQWHRFVIERWAYVLRVTVDGKTVFERFDFEPGAGGAGLFVAGGEVVFDDVAMEESPWQADDGKEFRISWSLGDRAKWYRKVQPDGTRPLFGRRGDISTQLAGMPVEEILIEHTSVCLVEALGLKYTTTAQKCRVFRRTEVTEPGDLVTLSVGKKNTLIRKVAVRYGNRPPDVFRIGPYHFTRSRIEDPSDYLDFTPEEYREIMQSPEVGKLRRRRKFRSLVGRGGSKCVWIRDRGRWYVGNGVLTGRGPNAVLRYSQDIICPVELSLRIKLGSPDSAVEIVLYNGPEPGVRVRFDGIKNVAEKSENVLGLHGQTHGEWHDLKIRVKGKSIEVQVDKKPAQEIPIRRGDGGQILLKVPAGSAHFDDIEFAVERERPGDLFYGFDRRETDWWRTGSKWLDHGGLACVLASNWVSLVAPSGKGTLWNKRMFGSDVLVAFNVEENGDWYGWDRNPNHVHHPYDNICVLLACEGDPDKGYRLELNSRNRTATVLYRNGKEVASVLQHGSFPMRYVGGHALYAPRRNRVSLVKRGGLLRAIVNGREILKYMDPEPIPVNRVGIGGYNTWINFSYIEIRELPLRTSCTEAGMMQLSGGFFPDSTEVCTLDNGLLCV